MTTWREEIERALRNCRESWGDIIRMDPTQDDWLLAPGWLDIDLEGDDRDEGPSCVRWWTRDWVYQGSLEDFDVVMVRLPRNPE